jgi:hypothetical protein
MKMKSVFLFTIITLLLFFAQVKAQIENVIVENYYTADANDATDTTGGHLKSGMTTYRIYVDLAPGSRLHKIYGDANHALKIVSDSQFFNNTSRAVYFGNTINALWFKNNPTIGLDTWLSLGFATGKYKGVLKEEDSDGSIEGGNKNNGGSGGIAAGILLNAANASGIPIFKADGMVLDTAAKGMSSGGDLDISKLDSSIFGGTFSSFISQDALFQNAAGVIGPLIDNKVLIGQFTTSGKLSFELNLELEEIDHQTGRTKTVLYVANKGTHNTDSVTVSSFLKYPAECGCKDLNYLEYDSKYGCDNKSLCKTLIVLGCMDPLSCNFDPKANVNVPDLCCYPGYCNDRDISMVCPDLKAELNTGVKMLIYPNPVQEKLSMELQSSAPATTNIAIYDGFGTLILEKTIANNASEFDVSGLPKGLYLIRVFRNGVITSSRFMKN